MATIAYKVECPVLIGHTGAQKLREIESATSAMSGDCAHLGGV